MPATSPVTFPAASAANLQSAKKQRNTFNDEAESCKENTLLQGSLRVSRPSKLRINQEDAIKESLQASMMDPSLQLQSPCNLRALAPSSVYIGTQTSRTNSNKVEVVIKSVSQHSISGYLTIERLSEAIPVMTTFFDGQILDGVQCGFRSSGRYESEAEVDQSHWERFPAYNSLGVNVTTNPEGPLDLPQRISESGHVFMRFKETFLVPDHSIKYIDGASYDGFYYIDLDVHEQTITGYYYHCNTEQNQLLKLKLQPSHHFDSYGFR